MGQKTIYYCDDNDLERFMIGRHLHGSDYDIHMFGCGEDLLAEMEKKKPDLVISDCHMPGIGGLEVLSVIKEKYKIPTILYTSDQTIPEEKVMEAGGEKALLFATKSCDKGQLLNAIETAITGDRSLQEKRAQILRQNNVGSKDSSRVIGGSSDKKD